MNILNRMLVCATVVASSASVLFAGTGLGHGINGTKTMKLTNKVGENVMMFSSDAPLEKINGSANGVSGSLVINTDNVEATTGTISVDVKSMKTGISKRDEHMYSATWLDAEKFPQIMFEILRLENVKTSGDGDNISIMAEAVGNFTLHGQTKEIHIPVTIKYVKESSATKARAKGDLIMANADFSVALKDFRVKGKSGLIGSKVGESIALKATIFGAAGE